MRENLIPFPYYNGMTREQYGINYTLNADGSVTAKGTKTNSSVSQYYFTYNITQGFKLEGGKTYRFSGCPKGGSSSTYRLRIIFYVNTTTQTSYSQYSDYGDGVEFTVPTEAPYIRTMIDLYGTNTSYNLVFYPSITKVFDYEQPKTDWITNDYFNITDYERIVGNIIETQDFASSLYSGYDIAEMMENVNYESIPHADNWNVISENIGIINQHTYNLPLEPNETYVDNGYSPNYEEFNRWETATERLMTTLRVEASTIPRLAKNLGRPMIGNR